MRGERGPTGPAGQRGEPGVCDVSKCSSDGANEVDSSSESSFVAFTAGLSRNFTRSLENKGIIVYDAIQLKYPLTSANGYSSKTGVFTAPTSGKSSLLPTTISPLFSQRGNGD